MTRRAVLLLLLVEAQVFENRHNFLSLLCIASIPTQDNEWTVLDHCYLMALTRFTNSSTIWKLYERVFRTDWVRYKNGHLSESDGQIGEPKDDFNIPEVMTDHPT